MAIHGTGSVGGSSKIRTANRTHKKQTASPQKKAQEHRVPADKNSVNHQQEAPASKGLPGFLNNLQSAWSDAADKVGDTCAGIAKGFSTKGQDPTTSESVQVAQQVEKFAGAGVAREVAKAPGTLRDAVCSVPKGVAENAQGVAGLLGHPLKSADTMGSKVEQFACQLKRPADFLHRQVDGVQEKGLVPSLMDGINTVTHPFKAVLGNVENEALDAGRRTQHHR